jgi:hypothetical protein
MIEKYAEMKFSYTYNYAGYIRQKVFDNKTEDYLSEIINPEMEKLLKPQKHTVLHDFIELTIEDELEYAGRKFEPEVEWEELLADYKVPFSKEEADEQDVEYVDYLEDKLKTHVVSRIANETFQLLFSDRMFCLKFNQIIAQETQKYMLSKFPEFLDKDGVLKRSVYFPTWVQRAVFLRDKGSCAICLIDLTGLLRTDFDKAIDHIVPLNLGGSNDITNLQLVCQACNLQKLGHTIRTSEHYPTYF